ncbi:D-hexose-6-phosphate mutarotase [uncultured Georgenia sp.]|uniref:D-hexose-6-phosphate mutarotase n=1 Tax=uncultured Georgenia sp. TaxID=378209 RepID=UPI00261EE317|nr:D-hexose-6-phosphate mutarotase [uncultured Georgenia sp.]HLV04120.1 D-hexose-6-phosphate mutarotase [Actinomycetaceae bacterium]
MSNAATDLPDSVTLAEGEGGLPVVRVATAVATGEVYLHGAHVTAWTPAGSDPVIWVSGAARFAAGEAIRGGIPICFPWFGAGREPGLAPPAHGFARITGWRLIDGVDVDGAVTLTFRLTDADVRGLPAAAAWPHAFTATYRVTFGRELDVALTVENTGDGEISFEEALHTYLAVSDARTTTVVGLDGAPYLDKVTGGPDPVTQRGEVTFTGETDRVYLSAADVIVRDEGAARSIGVTKEGSANTVVWNPWVDKAAAMADFGDDEWPAMVCVETANVLDDAVVLRPGERHGTTARYTVTR